MKPEEFTGTVVAKNNVYVEIEKGQIVKVVIGAESGDFEYHHILMADKNGVPKALKDYLNEPKRDWPAWEFGY